MYKQTTKTFLSDGHLLGDIPLQKAANPFKMDGINAHCISGGCNVNARQLPYEQQRLISDNQFQYENILQNKR